MSKHKIQITFMNLGASSLLVIFIVLCIAIFATLSLSGARSDYSFSEKMAHHKTAYYEACNTSELMLEEIDTILKDCASDGSGAYSFYAKCTEALSKEDFERPITLNTENAAPVISWEVPVDDTQCPLYDNQLDN